MINMEIVAFTPATFQRSPEGIFPWYYVVFYYCSSFETLGNIALSNCTLERYNSKIDSIKNEQRMPFELHFFSPEPAILIWVVCCSLHCFHQCVSVFTRTNLLMFVWVWFHATFIWRKTIVRPADVSSVKKLYLFFFCLGKTCFHS